MRIAEADLVPTEAHLRAGYRSFAELGALCAALCAAFCEQLTPHAPGRVVLRPPGHARSAA